MRLGGGGTGERGVKSIPRSLVTQTARDILTAFDTLSPAEQHQVTAEILRRSVADDALPDVAFDEMAAELFRAYDTEEVAAKNGTNK